jgi:hypothetical protein
MPNRKDVPIGAAFVKTRNGKESWPFGHLIDESILEMICAALPLSAGNSGIRFQ